MKISTQDGATQRWTKPIEAAEIVWFVGLGWGYAKDASGNTIPGAISKSGAVQDWQRITETDKMPPQREIVASTGG